jgi:multidrug efflux pump subunit AcrB
LTTKTQSSIFFPTISNPLSKAALEMIAPFELPQWFKQAYATLALVAVVGLLLSSVMGLLLLPVFYALYRGARRGD